MPLLDTYATVAEYKARNDKASAADDDELLEQLTGWSRLYDNELGWAPGAFNQSAGGTARVFPSYGEHALQLRDDRTLLNPFTVIDAEGIAVDLDGDGVYETTFDLTDAWCGASPANAAEFSEPFTELELLPLGPGAPITSWPSGSRRVRVTGTWGWSAVPPLITGAVIAATRLMRDAQEGGGAASIEFLESNVSVDGGNAWRVWRRVERRFNRRLRVVA